MLLFVPFVLRDWMYEAAQSASVKLSRRRQLRPSASGTSTRSLGPVASAEVTISTASASADSCVCAAWRGFPQRRNLGRNFSPASSASPARHSSRRSRAGICFGRRRRVSPHYRLYSGLVVAWAPWPAYAEYASLKRSESAVQFRLIERRTAVRGRRFGVRAPPDRLPWNSHLSTRGYRRCSLLLEERRPHDRGSRPAGDDDGD